MNVDILTNYIHRLINECLFDLYFGTKGVYNSITTEIATAKKLESRNQVKDQT
jgi:hypothetical protein